MGCAESVGTGEIVNGSVVHSANDDCDHQTQAVYQQMCKDFGGKGHRGTQAIDKIFEFVEQEAFQEKCNQTFLKASGGGDNAALNFTDFTKTLLQLLEELLVDTQQVGNDNVHYDLSSDEAAEWYSKVDSNNSGKIEKGEFIEVMHYFVCKAKLDSAIKMHSHLKHLKDQGDYVDMNEYFRSGGDCTFGPASQG